MQRKDPLPLNILFSRLKELSSFGPEIQPSALTLLQFDLESLSLKVYNNKKQLCCEGDLDVIVNESFHVQTLISSSYPPCEVRIIILI